MALRRYQCRFEGRAPRTTFSESRHRARTTFLRERKEEHRVSDAVFFVDSMGYLVALAKTDRLGDLNYSERNIIEKLF